ncbi:hypothetical protein GCM10009610_41090 [Pseudonocardia xinjiangensis]
MHQLDGDRGRHGVLDLSGAGDAGRQQRERGPDGLTAAVGHGRSVGVPPPQVVARDVPDRTGQRVDRGALGGRDGVAARREDGRDRPVSGVGG